MPRKTPLEGTLLQLAAHVGRHFAAMHNFPAGPLRDKFLEELREIQEDIRNWRVETNLQPEKADVKQAASYMDGDQVQFHLRCVAGRVLTLVDALVSDPVQRKAFKTYVKKEFREEVRRVENKFREWRSGGGSDQSEPEEFTVANAEFGR
jgi:hypothetical protein